MRRVNCCSKGPRVKMDEQSLADSQWRRLANDERAKEG